MNSFYQLTRRLLHLRATATITLLLVTSMGFPTPRSSIDLLVPGQGEVQIQGESQNESSGVSRREEKAEILSLEIGGLDENVHIHERSDESGRVTVVDLVKQVSNEGESREEEPSEGSPDDSAREYVSLSSMSSVLVENSTLAAVHEERPHQQWQQVSFTTTSSIRTEIVQHTDTQSNIPPMSLPISDILEQEEARNESVKHTTSGSGIDSVGNVERDESVTDDKKFTTGSGVDFAVNTERDESVTDFKLSTTGSGVDFAVNTERDESVTDIKLSTTGSGVDFAVNTERDESVTDIKLHTTGSVVDFAVNTERDESVTDIKLPTTGSGVDFAVNTERGEPVTDVKQSTSGSGADFADNTEQNESITDVKQSTTASGVDFAYNTERDQSFTNDKQYTLGSDVDSSRSTEGSESATEVKQFTLGLGVDSIGSTRQHESVTDSRHLTLFPDVTSSHSKERNLSLPVTSVFTGTTGHVLEINVSPGVVATFVYSETVEKDADNYQVGRGSSVRNSAQTLPGHNTQDSQFTIQTLLGHNTHDSQFTTHTLPGQNTQNSQFTTQIRSSHAIENSQFTARQDEEISKTLSGSALSTVDKTVTDVAIRNAGNQSRSENEVDNNTDVRYNRTQQNSGWQGNRDSEVSRSNNAPNSDNVNDSRNSMSVASDDNLLSHSSNGTTLGRTEVNDLKTTQIHETFSLTTRSPIYQITFFVELKLQMSWPDFCSNKALFCNELVDILHAYGQESFTEDQIYMFGETTSCSRENVSGNANGISEMEDISVRLYLLNKSHHYDVLLTNVCYQVIKQGFDERDTSHFKNKLLDVTLQPLQTPISMDKTTDKSNETKKNNNNSFINEPGVTIAVIIASVGGICCIILIIMQIILRRHFHSRSRLYIPDCNISITSVNSFALASVGKPRTINGAHYNLGLDLSPEHVSDKRNPRHIMNFMELSNMCMDVSVIYEEYKLIRNEIPMLSEIPLGAEDKNRFANVLPLPCHTRVKLNCCQGDAVANYINANFISGYNMSEKVYIATQAPLETTKGDFWQMVWEQKSCAIVMLINLFEEGHMKCCCYFPDSIGPEQYVQCGDYCIMMTRRDIQQEYITSWLQVKRTMTGEVREVRHFLLTCWPHTGQPEPISLVRFVLDTRPQYEDCGAPLVVHCSNGIGRTGMFIALDICMHQFEDQRRVDVMRCVHKLRQERGGCVQTSEQYTLLYNAVLEYATILTSPGISASSSAATLHAILP